MRLFLGLLACVFTLAPVQAYDDIARFSAAIPAEDINGPLFLYVAPPLGFDGVAVADYTMPQDFAIGRTLAMAKGVDSLTGLDFRKVYGVLSIGSGLAATNVVFADAGFTDNSAQAFLERGFTKADIGGVTVYAEGEDAAQDLSKASSPDPFGAGMGRSQRVALLDNTVVVTSTWAEMETALDAMKPKKRKTDSAWQAMFDALNQLRGQGNTEAAIGWSGSTFSAIDTTTEAILDGSIYQQAAEAGGQFLFPPFPAASLSIDRLHGDTNVRIAMPYRDARDAQLAAEHVGHYLVRFPKVPDNPVQQIVEAGDWHVAVLTIIIPGDKGGEAHALLRSFMSAVFTRQFAPLEFL